MTRMLLTAIVNVNGLLKMWSLLLSGLLKKKKASLQHELACKTQSLPEPQL